MRPASHAGVGLGESVGGELVVVPVGVDRTEQDRVLQDHVPVEDPGVDGGLGPGGGRACWGRPR